MVVTIRAARQADADKIATVHVASWRDAYRDMMPADYLRDQVVVDLTSHWRSIDYDGGDVFLVAEAEGEILGFVAVYRNQNPPYLDNLHVDVPRRSAGLGTKLMSAVASRLDALGETGVFLYIIRDNHKAQRFYERLGGVPTEESTRIVFNLPLPSLKIEWRDLHAIIRAAEAAATTAT
mmetsp:Transcript_2763/g.7150  ORF Transcript_2763/g.7150 Transcript_2763/m.7150 type:complete len:179 (-) Transcript_2763:281-817(-)|eukprot:CAMPEP_0197420082 /NCGR_PEP_ID=MMETSP1170-20131217/5552_1 /TAXON_ID=54406 /ORGANISM="Sarcinochrysis sp, Strain CCMP770" /LENGTH=178 /DNA_ID=CAMNT_0042947209 /DNA_START=108 /DNA_END=644 /DNA_ORIENTATION=-